MISGESKSNCVIVYTDKDLELTSDHAVENDIEIEKKTSTELDLTMKLVKFGDSFDDVFMDDMIRVTSGSVHPNDDGNNGTSIVGIGADPLYDTEKFVEQVIGKLSKKDCYIVFDECILQMGYERLLTYNQKWMLVKKMVVDSGIYTIASDTESGHGIKLKRDKILMKATYHLYKENKDETRTRLVSNLSTSNIVNRVRQIISNLKFKRKELVFDFDLLKSMRVFFYVLKEIEMFDNIVKECLVPETKQKFLSLIQAPMATYD